jgi:hypothetical protein
MIFSWLLLRLLPLRRALYRLELLPFGDEVERLLILAWMQGLVWRGLGRGLLPLGLLISFDS